MIAKWHTDSDLEESRRGLFAAAHTSLANLVPVRDHACLGCWLLARVRIQLKQAST